MEEIINILHNNQYSCVISNNDEIRTFLKPGVRDLYDLLKNDPGFLNGAMVADKVSGKAAASLMIIGGVKQLYTALISTPALDMLKNNKITVSFENEVPVILNRNQTDWCPLEILCSRDKSPEEFLPSIENFIIMMNSAK